MPRPKKSSEKVNTLPSLKITCTLCGVVKNDKDFYKSPSPIFAKNKGYMCVCKKCAEGLYKGYLGKYSNEFSDDVMNEELKFDYCSRRAIRRFCMMFDIFYDDNIFNLCLKEDNKLSMLVRYLKRFGIGASRGKTYDDTIDMELTMKLDTSSKNNDEDETTLLSAGVTESMIHFWGGGFHRDDYIFLQEQYDDWVARHECKTKSQEEIYKQICFTQLELLKANRTGGDKNLTDTFQKLLETAKLQPKQNDAVDVSDEETFGTLINKWEEHRPIPEVDPELADVDKLGLLIDCMFKGHTNKMLGVKNAYSKLYDEYMEQYTVHKPEYEEDTDTETIFDDIFSSALEREKQQSQGGEEFNDEEEI